MLLKLNIIIARARRGAKKARCVFHHGDRGSVLFVH